MAISRSSTRSAPHADTAEAREVGYILKGYPNTSESRMTEFPRLRSGEKAANTTNRDSLPTTR